MVLSVITMFKISVVYMPALDFTQVMGLDVARSMVYTRHGWWDD